MSGQGEHKKGFSIKQVLCIVVAAMLMTILATVFAIKIWLFPSPFTPVELSAREEQRLEQKLDRIDSFSGSARRGAGSPSQPATGVEPDDFDAQGALKPEAYSEKDANREVIFTERELNGLLANNTDLARKMAVDLDEDLVSLRLLLPIDPDFPVMGGKILRVRAGAELAYREGRPVVILKGISLMGVPLPNAWLGGLKNIDMMQEFGGAPGFWKSFGDGVESIRVREGELYIRLRE